MCLCVVMYDIIAVVLPCMVVLVHAECVDQGIDVKQTS